MLRLTLALAAVLAVPACKSAQEDFHAASAATLGVLRAAQENPELVDESKVLLGDLSGKALSPNDAALVQQALKHVNAGNVDIAAHLVAPLVAASAAAPKTP